MSDNDEPEHAYISAHLTSEDPSHHPTLWAHAAAMAASLQDVDRVAADIIQTELLGLGYAPTPKPTQTIGPHGFHLIHAPTAREAYDNGRLVQQFVHDLPPGWVFSWDDDTGCPLWSRCESADLRPRKLREQDPRWFVSCTIYLFVPWFELEQEAPAYQWFAHQGGKHHGVEHGMANTPDEAIAACRAWFEQHNNPEATRGTNTPPLDEGEE